MGDIEVKSQMSGSVWKILSKVGDRVNEDDVMIILESMKMEIPITAPEDGIVGAVLVKEGQAVGEGDVVARLVELG
jgi:acetyl-CoA carboxylase biotin carboxyl carrier protein